MTNIFLVISLGDGIISAGVLLSGIFCNSYYVWYLNKTAQRDYILLNTIIFNNSSHPLLSVYRLFVGPARRGPEKKESEGAQASAPATCPQSLPPKCFPRVGPGWRHDPHGLSTGEPAVQPSDERHAVHPFIFSQLPQRQQPVLQSANPEGQWCMRLYWGSETLFNIYVQHCFFFSSFVFTSETHFTPIYILVGVGKNWTISVKISRTQIQQHPTACRDLQNEDFWWMDLLLSE